MSVPLAGMMMMMMIFSMRCFLGSMCWQGWGRNGNVCEAGLMQGSCTCWLSQTEGTGSSVLLSGLTPLAPQAGPEVTLGHSGGLPGLCQQGAGEMVLCVGQEVLAASAPPGGAVGCLPWRRSGLSKGGLDDPCGSLWTQ